MSDTTRYSRIEIAKNALSFSVAHFTVFSPTERENIHGHNFQVGCDIYAPIDENGLTLDYAILKKMLRDMCDELDEKVLLPANSPWLELVDENDYTVAIFNDERIPFLKRDVLILPIANTTVEELSHYLLGKVRAAPALEDLALLEITVRVSSGPGQTGAASWRAS